MLQVSSPSIVIAQTAGGLNPQEMEAVRKAIDPERKLTESQRNLAALGSVYQYWANKGDPQKAQRVAFQMLQHYRLAVQRYAAIAAHVANEGNLGLAAKATLKAYANVPEGKDMELTNDPDDPKRLVYSFTDENGKTILKGIPTPQQLAASAMGLATDGFDKALLAAAKPLDEESARVGGGASNTPSAGARRVGSPQRLYLPPPPSMNIEEFVPPTRKSLPSINCVTLREELNNGSTTHCESD